MRQEHNSYRRFSNNAGTIRENVIIHDDNEHSFADVGIILEDSADTIIVEQSVIVDIQERLKQTDSECDKNKKPLKEALFIRQVI